jgi:trk system potassium uptake protein
MSIKIAHISPGLIIFVSLLFTIVCAMLLLALPHARTTSIGWLDLAFTATSALCVTGLFTVPLDSFSTFGHAIILMLIQLGGLGLITITLATIYLVAEVGLSTQFLAGKIFEVDSWQDIKQILLFSIVLTIGAELLGFLLLIPLFLLHYPPFYACFVALFHAVSSFCNAGITLRPDFMYYYQGNILLLLITMVLCLVGGLGFFTSYEIMQYVRSLGKKRHHRFSLLSKIALWSPATILVLSVIVFWILESPTFSTHQSPLADSWIHALFHAITLKSAGFLLCPIGAVQPATLLCILVISFIGSAPASTGSGIKITTCALIASTISSAIRGRIDTEIYGRSIEKTQVNKAIAIVAIAFCWIFLAAFCLLIFEPEWTFLESMFASCSAFTNLGITLKPAAHLAPVSKLCILASMIAGRIGSLTLILALQLKQRQRADFSYPEERVLLS